MKKFRKMYGIGLLLGTRKLLEHCPRNNLNLRIKTEPVKDVTNTTVYVWIMC